MAARIGILTVSDTRTLDDDLSGPAVEGALRASGFSDFERRIVRDEVAEIQEAILSLAEACQAVFTTGGTGFTPRDVTPEATAEILTRQADCIAELIRLKGLEHTLFSYLSRGVAGIVGSTLVVNLPGSPAGARQGVIAVTHLINPILSALGGDGCPI